MSNTFPSPVSDESSSEGTPLREFVDATIAQEQQQQLQHQPVLATSPRQALLSHTSFHDPLRDDNDIQDDILDNSRNSRRSASDRRRRERDLTKANNSERELVRLLIDQEQEASKLRKALRMSIQRMEAESRRVMDLEKANQAASTRFRSLNESRLAAEQEANKAQQELRLYQVKLDNVQKAAERTQEALHDIERQRDQAEEAATRARAQARKIAQEKAVAAAREEGRRLGYEAGFEHARRERQITAARRAQAAAAVVTSPTQTSPRTSARTTSTKTRTSSRTSHHRHEPGPSNRHRHQTPRPVHPDVPLDADDLDDLADPIDLPLRNLPTTMPSAEPPAPSTLPNFTAHGTPMGPFEPPPVTPPHHTGPQHQQPSSSSHFINQYPPRPTSPSIQMYSISIPPTEQIVKEFNANEEYNDHHPVTTQPREEWVPAATYHEIAGISPRSSVKLPPGQPAPSLIPKRPGPSPINKSNLAGPSKLNRLFSISKTKEHAQSWYRSFSFRKKNKPIIDPIHEDKPATTPASAPGTASSFGHPPTHSPAKSRKGKEREQPPSEGSETQYGAPPAAAASWYMPKNGGSAAPSLMSRRYMDDNASVSTRVSQFDLLSTPLNVPGGSHLPPGMAGSNGPGSKRIREMDSVLTMIKEDSSRGNTPNTERVWGSGGQFGNAHGHSRSASSPTSMVQPPGQPMFPVARGVQQKSSRGTMNSTGSHIPRRSRARGLSIDVPDPDAPLEPAGVAYQRASGHGNPYNKSSASLTRRPSRISEKTTPDTSIAIDVIPPSSMPPEIAQEPPHTGVNHLSPYHAYNAPAPRMPFPNQSATSLRSNRSGAPPSNGYFGNSLSAGRREDDQRSTRSQAAPKTPKSTHSAAPSNKTPKSRKSHLQLHVVASEGPANSPRPSAKTARGSTTSVNKAAPAPTLTAPQKMQRVASNLSFRSQGSFGKYDPTEYTDPAFWGYNSPDGAPSGPAPGRKSASRASFGSDLSYA